MAHSRAKPQPIAELNPFFPSSEARDKTSSAKLLDQPLARLNGKLQAKLIVSLKARLPRKFQGSWRLALSRVIARPEAIPLGSCKAKCLANLAS